MKSPSDSDNNEYDELTEFDCVRYELATIYYDFQVHPKAQARIDLLITQLERKYGTNI